MDRNEAKQIMAEAQKAMDAVFAAHNLNPAKIRATFDESMIKISLTGECTGAAAPKITSWARYARSFGLPEDALGKTILQNGVPFEITGLAPSRTKYPVTAKNLRTGKDMLLTIVGVKRALGIKVESWEI